MMLYNDIKYDILNGVHQSHDSLSRACWNKIRIILSESSIAWQNTSGAIN